MFFSFQVTCERWLSHARNVNILHTHDASCLVLVTLDFSKPIFIQWFLKPQVAENTLAHCFKSLTRETKRKQSTLTQTRKALKAHGFSQKEGIVQNIWLALDIRDIQPIRVINRTKNRTNGYGRLIDMRSGVTIVCYLYLTIMCCYVCASCIYFQIRHSRI